MINAIQKKTSIDTSRNKERAYFVTTRTYKTMSEVEIARIFQQECKDEKIVDTKYSDETWKLFDTYKDTFYNLQFDKFSSLTDELKAFIVLILEDGSPSNAYRRFIFLRRILETSDDLTHTIIEINKAGAIYSDDVEIYQSFLEFIECNNDITRQITDELIMSVKPHEDKSRPLPNYQSVVKFDKIINDVINSPDSEEKLTYFPVVLWWKLTMIIPMRPIEFFILKSHDLYEKAGCKWIHITRSKKSTKNANRKTSIPLISEFKINNDVYELFQYYIKNIDVGNEDYIFNITSDPLRKISGDLQIYEMTEFAGRDLLDGLLEKFFNNIISCEYGYNVIKKETKQTLDENEIEYINYGDTRHLSFLNLILSGYNPYTIAQLGGHTQLSTQNHYYAGLTAYCTSKAYALAYGITEIQNKDALTMTKWRQNHLLLSTTDLTGARKITGGYCTSKNFPYECYTSDCQDGTCSYFLFSEEKDIERQKKEVQDDMLRQQDVLRAILYTDDATGNGERIKVVHTMESDVIKLARLIKCENRLHETGGENNGRK